MDVVEGKGRRGSVQWTKLWVEHIQQMTENDKKGDQRFFYVMEDEIM